jgi:hypothetical protein
LDKRLGKTTQIIALLNKASPLQKTKPRFWSRIEYIVDEIKYHSIKDLIIKSSIMLPDKSYL